MKRIHQLAPRFPSRKIERWWGQSTQKSKFPAKEKIKVSSRALRIIYKRRLRIHYEIEQPIVLEASAEQCLASYICQVLKLIYILHWLPMFRRPR